MLFGYNRDGKKGHEQVVLGLLCNAEGCPVGGEVFAGNTQDGQGKNRQWTIENVLERLMDIRKQRVKVAQVEFDQVTQVDEEQQKILDLLKVKL